MKTSNSFIGNSGILGRLTTEQAKDGDFVSAYTISWAGSGQISLILGFQGKIDA